VSTASSCVARYSSSWLVCASVSLVELADCKAMALIGVNTVLSTAHP
jgi:hypothetical protein